MSIFDRRYYIMDSDGNSYRVGDNDKLVLVRDDEEADTFDVLEANKRIGNSGRSTYYRIIEVKNHGKTQAIKQETVSEPVCGYCMEDMDFEELLRKLCFVHENIERFQREFRDKQSDVDLKICDILHYIELYEQHEDESADLINRLQDCRNRRRKIKDELYRIDAIERIFKIKSFIPQLKESFHMIENMDMRKYTPRKLPELFANGIEIDGKRGERPVSESIENRFVVLDGGQKVEEAAEEETDMDYERKMTVYDGRKNNWLAFAKMQQEFYGNAEQYMVNLQIESEELDHRIEALLEQIETANYNVTQGYKVFKQLKNMRVLRKEKDQELQCLESLIEGFDCRAMYDAFAYSQRAIEDIVGVSEAFDTEEVKEEVS